MSNIEKIIRLPSASTSLIISCNSASVGFWPRDRMTVPSSLVVTVPSPSLSNSENASLNSGNTDWRCWVYGWKHGWKSVNRTSIVQSWKICRPNIVEFTNFEQGMNRLNCQLRFNSLKCLLRIITDFLLIILILFFDFTVEVYLPQTIFWGI